ncbi:MAG TPA: sigma 54-interacting transcriptional regulator [Polyangiaceae bacterium]|nr:sigma 54-interacting transcriptional regulator [Polyangiaceae bacterium]
MKSGAGDGDVLTVNLEPPSSSPVFTLRALGPSFVFSISLPPSGAITLGRSPEADVKLDDPSVSRMHARLRVVATGVSIEDLGSANGTRVGSRLLGRNEAAVFEPGHAANLGAVTLVLSVGHEPAPRSVVVANDEFASRLARASLRAGRGEPGSALARFYVGGRLPAREIEQTLEESSPGELLAALVAAGDYALLFDGLAAPEARARLERAAARLRAQGASVSFEVESVDGDVGRPTALLSKPTPPPPAAPAGQPTAMDRARQLVALVADSTITVLLVGETGVGKEVTAEEIHRRSSRAHGPFLRLNCGAFSESLLESELYGHEKGAFTGAVQAKPGLLEAARGGTVFLDEVGELPLRLQVKLLRVLEDHQVLRVGGLSPRPIDVRFVAATNRDLEREVAEGNFRRDLFFRLNGIIIQLPPLRERPEEILQLAETFLGRASDRAGRPLPVLPPETRETLMRHPWPGNVRELRNVMERAVLLCRGGVIRDDDLHLERAEAAPASNVVADSETSTSADDDEERRRVLDALARCAGNQTQAAKLLGISRGTLLARLDAYNLPRPRKGRRSG